MRTKSQADEIQGFLSYARYVHGGHETRVVFPENADEVAEILAQASVEETPVTVSGAGTGTVAGRVPFGGIVLATDRLNQIEKVVREGKEGRAVAEAGVILRDIQQAVDSHGLFYPPDPTARGCFLGGAGATNASAAP